MSKRTELLSDLARQALSQYDADVKAGGEPIYPLWARELLEVLDERAQLVTALRDLFDSYKSLADSGDAGNWSLEDLDEGKAAIAALAATEAA